MYVTYVFHVKMHTHRFGYSSPYRLCDSAVCSALLRWITVSLPIQTHIRFYAWRIHKRRRLPNLVECDLVAHNSSGTVSKRKLYIPTLIVILHLHRYRQ